MTTEFFAALSFILISTFTPGPNNISSAAMGALHGYKNTASYLFGITVGFFIMVLICALVSASVLSLFPELEAVLRYVGAAYIVYLAYGILRASYSFNENDEAIKPLAFTNGFLLQLLNPKLIVYALTLFSTFLAPIVTHPTLLVLAVILLTLVAFCSISVWALFGTLIKRYLRHPRAKILLNAGLSLFLVYTALELAHIL